MDRRRLSSTLGVGSVDLESRLVMPAASLLEPVFDLAGGSTSGLEAPDLGREHCDLSRQPVLAIDQRGPTRHSSSSTSEPQPDPHDRKA